MLFTLTHKPEIVPEVTLFIKLIHIVIKCWFWSLHLLINGFFSFIVWLLKSWLLNQKNINVATVLVAYSIATLHFRLNIRCLSINSPWFYLNPIGITKWHVMFSCLWFGFSTHMPAFCRLWLLSGYHTMLQAMEIIIFHVVIVFPSCMPLVFRFIT